MREELHARAKDRRTTVGDMLSKYITSTDGLAYTLLDYFREHLISICPDEELSKEYKAIKNYNADDYEEYYKEKFDFYDEMIIHDYKRAYLELITDLVIMFDTALEKQIELF